MTTRETAPTTNRSRLQLGVALLSALATLACGAAPAEAAVAVDKTVTAHQTAAAKTIVSPTFSTAPGELLLALLSSDGPKAGAQTFSSVTGGGLTWRLRRRANTQAGTAEIWAANAPSPLTNASGGVP